jgi:hypothetical protein
MALHRYITFILISFAALSSLNAQEVNDNPHDTSTVITNDTIIDNTIISGNILVADSVQKETHSPKRAGIYSAILPGWGQGYNHKYWKIPIIWTGFAATGYLIYRNAVPMQKAYNAYIWIDQGSEGTPPNEYATQYPSLTKLESLYNQYRHNVELYGLVSAAWYVLNIIDAIVDAHLMDFDISDDLSLNISPEFAPITISGIPQNNYPGITMHIHF